MMPFQKPTFAKLPFRTEVGYGVGDYGLNLFWQGINFYLFFFYTDVMGLQSGLAGTLVALGGIWDAFSDPLMGVIAERTRSRWGAYRPYVLFGSLPLAFSFALTFYVPGFIPTEWLWLYAFATLILFKTCYTVVSIPYSTLGARMSTDGRERIRLSGVRMYFGFLGGVSVIALADLFQTAPEYGNTYFPVAVACGVISIIALVACFRGTSAAVSRRIASETGPTISETLKALVKNRAFLHITGATMSVTVANTIISATMLYVFTHGTGDFDAGQKALFIMAGMPLLTIPFWASVALRLGKKTTWHVACGIAVMGLALLYLALPAASSVPALAACAVLAFGTSAHGVLFWGMLPDTVEYGETATGVRNESSIFGMVSAGQKLALAGAAFVTGLLLEVIGYQAGTQATQATTEGLVLLITVLPAGGILCSALFVRLYPVSARSHLRATAQLQAREESL